MELLISKEVFKKWIEKYDWLLTAKVATPTGHQFIYITPEGHFVISIYNLKGDLENIAQPITVMPTPMSTRQGPGLDILGSRQPR
jgi:hypothetical protein